MEILQRLKSQCFLVFIKKNSGKTAAFFVNKTVETDKSLRPEAKPTSVTKGQKNLTKHPLVFPRKKVSLPSDYI